jgi:hypothetical protein
LLIIVTSSSILGISGRTGALNAQQARCPAASKSGTEYLTQAQPNAIIICFILDNK